MTSVAANCMNLPRDIQTLLHLQQHSTFSTRWMTILMNSCSYRQSKVFLHVDRRHSRRPRSAVTTWVWRYMYKFIYFIISDKWTKWMAEIMRSFDVCLFVGLCVCVCSGRSWELNANSSKTVKATDFKFDTSLPRVSPDMTPKNFSKRGRS